MTISLIGGQRLLREAMASLLAAGGDLCVLATYDSVAQFVGRVRDETPAVVVVDNHCADGVVAGRHAIAALTRQPRAFKVVVICDEILEEMVPCAIGLGVDGLILRSYSSEAVRATIGCVAGGHTVMPVGWQQKLTQPGQEPDGDGLSPRHRQILGLIAEGHCNEEIAARLVVSQNTVKFHVRALYARLGVRNRVEAANRHQQMINGLA